MIPKPRIDSTARRSSPFRRVALGAPLPLLLLAAAACGERYELGTLEQESSRTPPVDAESIGSVILTNVAEADADLVFDAVPELLTASAVAAADLDGDGYSDLVIGSAVIVSDKIITAIRIAYGGARSGDGTLAVLPGQTLTAWPVAYGSELHAAPAGDVNGDGYADVFVGQKEWYYTAAEETQASSPADLATQRAYLLYGSPDRHAGPPRPLADVAVAFEDPDGVGSALFDGRTFVKTTELKGIGDIDGDGYADFTQTSRASADPSSETLPSGIIEAVTHLHYGQGERFGVGVSAPAATLVGATILEPLGDVNGDGLADVVVSSSTLSTSEVGLRILPGRTARYGGEVSLAAAGVPIVGPSELSDPGSVGYPASGNSLGDLDGDGYGDFITQQAVLPWELPQQNIFYGAPGLLGGALAVDAAAVIDATGAAWRAFSPGDWDGDGLSDLVFSHITYQEQWTGLVQPVGHEAVLLRGNGVRLAGSYDVPLVRSSVTPLDFYRMEPAGDLDGDGHSDLLVQGLGRRPQSSGFYVKYGASNALPPIH